MPDDRSAPPFELGLVMAGAISAGAYTAGVVDFLLQALEAWQQARDRGDDVSAHDVRIKVLTGASAGGMTTAITAALLSGEHRPVTMLPGRRPTDDEASSNPLYASWVRDIDITHLLGTRDLEPDGAHVRSILDASVLDDIAERALRFTPGARRRTYFDDPLHLYVTLTNLRGVPYRIRFAGTSDLGHGLSLHADHMHFVWSREPADEGLWLNPNDPDHPNWQLLAEAALATGAFPGGLAPRHLQRPSSDYTERAWTIPQAVTNGASQCHAREEIPPQWPTSYGEDPFDYDFLCVDGGVINNEPLELARRRLAGDAESNPRDAKDVSRSVLMIDPFPTTRAMTLDEVEAFGEYDVVKTLLRMVTALKFQARFKIDELKLAQDEHVHSRFLIAPTRTRPDGKLADHAMASATLGGFGGFLSELFRIHDFQLGRRNCQKFLRDHFRLPLEDARQNPVFAADDHLDRRAVTHEGTAYVPIIPLVGEADREVFPLRWETLRLRRKDLDVLRGLVEQRTRAVLDRLTDQYIDDFWARRLVKLVTWRKRDAVVDGIMNAVEKDLEEFGLHAERVPA